MSKDGIDKYKELQKRLALMRDGEWLNTIDNLKKFEPDDSKSFYVVYREEKQRKERSIGFDAVQYVEETNTFIFTSYQTDYMTGERTDEVRSKMTLQDIDIITLGSNKKFDASDWNL